MRSASASNWLGLSDWFLSLRRDQVAFDYEHRGCGNVKARAEEFVAKAIAGEATLIEQNGKRAVLLPCQGIAPDFELDLRRIGCCANGWTLLDTNRQRRIGRP